MSQVATAVWSARRRISMATTAKPSRIRRFLGLDGGVEREQIGLVGHFGNGRDDRVDIGRPSLSTASLAVMAPTPR